MKIGTDGVLLGAWTSVKKYPNSILDIGTGTGVIALQLAQKSDAELIDALEIDAEAFEQAVDNFERSLWADRLFCYHTSLMEFTHEVDDKYDLIVSNPPFYTDEYQSENKGRTSARSTTSLSFENLLLCVSKLLTENGIFSVIIPFKEESHFVSLAEKSNLYINKICRVKGSHTSEIKRSLMAFSFHKKEVETADLTIETERHQYTENYKNLVKDFYLKM